MHKYGWAIGRLTAPVEAGGWIHSHNLKTQLEGTLDYTYEPAQRGDAPRAERTGEGF